MNLNSFKTLILFISFISCYNPDIESKQQRGDVIQACNDSRGVQKDLCDTCKENCSNNYDICTTTAEGNAEQALVNVNVAAGRMVFDLTSSEVKAYLNSVGKLACGVEKAKKQKCENTLCKGPCDLAGTACPGDRPIFIPEGEDFIDIIVTDDEGDEILDAILDLDGFPLDDEEIEEYVDVAGNVTRLEGLAPGRYILTIKAENYGVRSMPINVTGTPGALQSLTISLRPGNSVSGEVKWNNGSDHPIEGAKVMLKSLADDTRDFTVTDAYGEYEFPFVSAGSYQVIAFAEDFTAKELPPFIADGENRVTGLDFTYPSSTYLGTISGTVVQNNVPKPGFTVRIALSDLSPSSRLIPLDVENHLPYIETTTNSYGEFEINNAPRDFVKIAAFQGKKSSTPMELNLVSHNSLSNVEIEVIGMNMIQGTVTDHEEIPLEDMKVTAFAVENDLSPSDKLVLDFPGIAITNEYGEFSLYPLPIGDYDLYAAPVNYNDPNIFSVPAIVTTYAGNEDAEVIIEERGSIRGNITCENVSSAGPCPCEGEVFEVGLSPDSLVTFELNGYGEGTFEIPNLPAGTYQLYIRSGWLPALSVGEIEVEVGEETLLNEIIIDYNLYSSVEGDVEGYIIDTNLDPVVGATVMITDHFIGNGLFLDTSWPVKMAITDEYGYYTIEGIPYPMDGSLYAIAEYKNFRSSPMIVDGREVNFLVEATGSLEGAIECDSEPIPSVIEVTSLPDKSLSLHVNTDSDGYYRIDRLAPGDYRISVIPTISVCGMETGIEVASDEITIESDETEDISLDIDENEPPVADAGEDQIVYDDDSLGLDGTESSDPDNNIISYDWFKFNLETGGLDFVDDEDEILVDAPELDTFDMYFLIVTDSFGAQSQDAMIIAHIEEP